MISVAHVFLVLNRFITLRKRGDEKTEGTQNYIKLNPFEAMAGRDRIKLRLNEFGSKEDRQYFFFISNTIEGSWIDFT